MLRIMHNRWLVGFAAVGLVLAAGCQTMDMASLKSRFGAGASGAKAVTSSLQLGVQPLKRAAVSSPLVPPADVTPPRSSSRAVKSLISSGKLAEEYNGVLVSFLANEGTRWMAEKERKAALDQAVTSLKKKVNVTKDEQIETGLGTAIGLAMQLAGGDIVGRAGSSVAGDYHAEVSEWIDAAYDLAKLGYKDDASRFFEHGMKYFSYDDHRGRCVAGYAMVHPEEAYAFLSSKLKGTGVEEVKAAIRMMGHLAASPALDAAAKTRCVETVASYATGMMNTTYYLDAIYALDVCNDSRAVPALRKFMKGMMVSDEQQRPALTSLALRYKDPEAIEVLKGILNAGMMATYDWRDKQFAFKILVRAGDDAGYAYARTVLGQRGKGFFDAKDQPDLRPEVIDVLVNYGDRRGVAAIVPSFDIYRDDEWIKTWSATAMMLLGEGAAKNLAAQNINREGWEFSAVSIAQGLAMYGDYRGFETLKRLISLRQVKAGPGAQLLEALSGRQSDKKAEEERLTRLRVKTAYALGKMDHAQSVPLLEVLLDDESDMVRRAAASALCDLSIPEAIPLMVKAISRNYGEVSKQKIDTTPGVHARIVRTAGNRWGKDAKVSSLLGKAAESRYASVRMLAVAMEQ